MRYGIEESQYMAGNQTLLLLAVNSHTVAEALSTYRAVCIEARL